MEIHVYIGNKSNGFACKTLRQILVYILTNFTLTSDINRDWLQPLA